MYIFGAKVTDIKFPIFYFLSYVFFDFLWLWALDFDLMGSDDFHFVIFDFFGFISLSACILVVFLIRSVDGVVVAADVAVVRVVACLLAESWKANLFRIIGSE